jgi:hypothetical protein
MITNIIGRLARLRKSNTIERENENIFSAYCFLENSMTDCIFELERFSLCTACMFAKRDLIPSSCLIKGVTSPYRL